MSDKDYGTMLTVFVIVHHGHTIASLASCKGSVYVYAGSTVKDFLDDAGVPTSQRDEVWIQKANAIRRGVLSAVYHPEKELLGDNDVIHFYPRAVDETEEPG